MKIFKRNVILPILAVLFSMTLAAGIATFSGARYEKVSADTESVTLTKTMHKVSKSGDYLLIVTAFDLTEADALELGDNEDLVIGYTVNGTDHNTQTYYSSLLIKQNGDFISQGPANIFGSDYAEAERWGLIVMEIDYDASEEVDYQAYVKKVSVGEEFGENDIFDDYETIDGYEFMGKKYGNRKYDVTFMVGEDEYDAQSVSKFRSAEKPEEPTLAGNYFAGWYDGEEKFDFSTEITEDVTLHAAFKATPSFGANDGYLIDEGQSVTFSATNFTNVAAIKLGETELTEGTDYSYTDGDLTITNDFLNDQYRFGATSLTLTAEFADSEDDLSADIAIAYPNAANRVLNGGFETGDLYGWNAYQIWKNESGMKAWTDGRVVNVNYFRWDNSGNGYSYNKDGEYNLGIYTDYASQSTENAQKAKDSAQERMGHLRSANFTLGGSGWISFKLGGGKNRQFEYVSVRKTEGNEEIARFWNKNFKNKSLSGTDNAEGYMFQYYYDLSAYKGQQLYFTISDTTSNEWCVLSADSFFTYYPDKLTPSDAQTAENILPSISNIGSSTNEIVGGNPFASETFSSWTVDGGWGRSGEEARSSVNGGDDAVGVLRSPAFNVGGDNPKTYIRFDWAGYLKADKQVFVSIKEVGTNIEVMRFVRREADSGTQSGDWKMHFLDVSGLDPDKEYYLEFADNITKKNYGDWAVAYVKSLRFTTSSDSDLKDSRKAVSISGIVTDYTYVNPY